MQFGSAAGAAIGGLVVSVIGLRALPLVGAAAVLVSLILVVVTRRPAAHSHADGHYDGATTT